MSSQLSVGQSCFCDSKAPREEWRCENLRPDLMAQGYAFRRPSVVGLKFLLRDSSEADITSSWGSNRTAKVDPRHSVAPSKVDGDWLLLFARIG